MVSSLKFPNLEKLKLLVKFDAYHIKEVYIIYIYHIFIHISYIYIIYIYICPRGIQTPPENPEKVFGPQTHT